MVILQSQHIISPAIDDRLRDGFLTAHRINGHHRIAQVEQGQQVRNGRDLIGFLGDRLLRHHPTSLPGKGTDQMHRRILAIPTAAHGLAIHTHLLTGEIR